MNDLRTERDLLNDKRAALKDELLDALSTELKEASK